MAANEPQWLQDRLDGLNRLARQVHEARLEEDDILHSLGKHMGLKIWPWYNILGDAQTEFLPPHLSDRCAEGTFDVSNCLGSGGGGVVLVGWVPDEGRHCALKFAAADKIAHLIVECATASLTGADVPGIVQFHGLVDCAAALPPSDDASQTTFLMQFVQGMPEHLARGAGCVVMDYFEDSLAGALNRELPPCSITLMVYGRHMIIALRNIHGLLHTYHRDFKPDNLLVAGAGVDARLVVADCGLAQWAYPGKSNAFLHTYQAQGRVVGTLGFVDPDAHGADKDAVGLGLSIAYLIGAGKDVAFYQDLDMKGIPSTNRVELARASIKAARILLERWGKSLDHFHAASQSWFGLPTEVAYALTIGAHVLLHVAHEDVPQLLLGTEDLFHSCFQAVSCMEAGATQHYAHLQKVLQTVRASLFDKYLVPAINDNIDALLKKVIESATSRQTAPPPAPSMGLAQTAYTAMAAAARLVAGAGQAAAAAMPNFLGGAPGAFVRMRTAAAAPQLLAGGGFGAHAAADAAPCADGSEDAAEALALLSVRKNTEAPSGSARCAAADSVPAEKASKRPASELLPQGKKQKL